jgi:SprT protein
METIEVKNRLVEATKFWVDLANEILNKNFSYPTVDFNVRGTCGGKAWWSQNRVSYNLGIAAENLTHFKHDTVGHEVAHVIAGRLYGQGCGHGPLWKHLMKRMGLKPERCHNYDTTNHKV